MARKIINTDQPPLLWSTVEQAFTDINDNFTEVYLSIGDGSSNPIDLTSLGTDLIPVSNATFDLGSQSNAWKSVFASEFSEIGDANLNGFWAGDAQIKGIGTTIDLPLGSTVDGDLIKDPADGSFKTIAVEGQDDIVASDLRDTLEFQGTGIAITSDTGTNSLTFTNSGVTQLNASTGINVDSTTGNITITNTGVTQLAGGLGIGVSSSTGNVTVANEGIVSVTAGSGIIVSAKDPITGDITITNSSPNTVQFTFNTIAIAGQDDIIADTGTDTLNYAAGDGIELTTNASTDLVTFTNTGVTSVAGTSGINVSGSTGSVVFSNTGVTSITAGSGISVDSSTGDITLSNTRLGFTSMSVDGQDPILADNTTDTMVFVAGDGIVLNTDADTDSLSISVTPELLETSFNVAVVGSDSQVSTIDPNNTLTFVAGTNIVLDTDQGNGVITISSTASGGGGGGGDYSLFVAADDSTVYNLNSGNTLQINGATGVTTAVDADGTFTITGPDLSSYATESYVDTEVGNVNQLQSRTTINGTTSSLADNANENLDITGFKGYFLLKIETDAAAWVRVYTDSASRTADSGRSELTDPDPGDGVIAEVITTGAETVLISPGALGYNNESSPTTNVPINVKNKSGTTTTITVTLTVIQVEA